MQDSCHFEKIASTIQSGAHLRLWLKEAVVTKSSPLDQLRVFWTPSLSAFEAGLQLSLCAGFGVFPGGPPLGAAASPAVFLILIFLDL